MTPRELAGFRWIMADLAHTKRIFLAEVPPPRDKLAKLRFYRRGYIDGYRQDFRGMSALRRIVNECGGVSVG